MLIQLKAHVTSITFLMTGYIIAILVISIGTSSIVEIRQLALEKTQGNPKNSLIVTASFNDKFSYKEFINVFKGNSTDTNVKLVGIYATINNCERKDISFSITAELFNSIPDWTAPLISGKYYTKEDIINSNKVVLIGKDLEKYTVTENKKTIIKIDGELYEVVGIIGKQYNKSVWDSHIFMPITALPREVQETIEGQNYFNFLLYNNNHLPLDDANKIKDNLLKRSDKAIFDMSQSSENNNTLGNIFAAKGSLLLFMFVIFITALINVINLTKFWIIDRKFEIGVRKSFGASNINLSIMLFSEMLFISLIACLISLVLQKTLSLCLFSIGGYSLNVSTENWIVSIFASLISAIITSILPIKTALSIQPIESLRL
jgi:putative ABC transport system permease protein